MPLISIIIPVYNVERYLSECLDSVLAQTIEDFELILVNDGSTDSSGKICDAYAEIDNRIRVFHQANAGSSTARNLGICIAQGKYICFVDSDDTITPYYLENFLPGIQLKADLSVQSLCEHVEGNITNRKTFDVSFYTSITDAIDHGLIHFPGPVCKLFIAEIIKRNAITFPPHIAYGEDSVFHFTYLSHISTVYTTSECGYYYRKGINSISQKKHDPKALFLWLEHIIGVTSDIYKSSGKKSPLPNESSLSDLKGLLANIVSLSYSKSEAVSLLKKIRYSKRFNLSGFPVSKLIDKILKQALLLAPYGVIILFLKKYFK